MNRHRSTDVEQVEQEVWDIPIRLFHWSIVILIGFAWWSGEQRLLDWHRRAGYAVLCLLLFRVLWGFFGSRHARFANFLSHPARAIGYARKSLFTRRTSMSLGHNPIGGWSVIVLLGVMLLQTLLGLFAVDIDGLESGPLSYLVSFEMGRIAAETHHLVFNALLLLIGLHVAAIAFYLIYKNENLTKAMITGKAHGDGTVQHHPPYSLSTATLLFVSSAFFVFLIAGVFGR